MDKKKQGRRRVHTTTPPVLSRSHLTVPLAKRPLSSLPAHCFPGLRRLARSSSPITPPFSPPFTSIRERTFASLPETATSTRDRVLNNLLMQLAPPMLLTILNLIEVTWWGFEYVLVTVYRCAHKTNGH